MPLTLYSSTGQQDDQSIWGQGFLQTVETLGNTAANIITALRGSTGASLQVAPTTQAQTPLTTAPGAAQNQGGLPSWVWPVTALVGIGIAAALVLKR
jgi:hypothetical protein